MYFADSSLDFKFGDVIFDFIYPMKNISGDSFQNINNSSLAFILSYQSNKILMTGDLEMDAEKIILESGIDLKANIFKAGHHGSRSSSSMDFLKKVRPEKVIPFRAKYCFCRGISHAVECFAEIYHCKEERSLKAKGYVGHSKRLLT